MNQSIVPEPKVDEHGRVPFEHPALANVDRLVAKQPQDILDKDRVTRLATEVGLTDVVRWKPAKVRTNDRCTRRLQPGLLTLCRHSS